MKDKKRTNVDSRSFALAIDFDFDEYDTLNYQRSQERARDEKRSRRAKRALKRQR